MVNKKIFFLSKEVTSQFVPEHRNRLGSNFFLAVVFLCISYNSFFSQTLDSVVMQEIIITAYPEERPMLRLPSSAVITDSSHIHLQSGQSMVPVLNTMAGVHMEERSPGSYRLSVRGSLLRSPFGVRNVKVYLDEFPLTNAGGETYLNLPDVNSIHQVEVLKGPDGSLFGANSGGVVRLTPFKIRDTSSYITAGAGLGSFGLFQQQLSLHQHSGKHTIALSNSWQRSDGYRQNSSLNRKFMQLMYTFNYSKKGKFKLYGFYADLFYETPGGLTYLQYMQDPSQARPPTGMLHGAEEQKAAVHNQTIYSGLLHEYTFNSEWKHVIAVFGSHTFFQNPFISNYEIRDESNGGARTWLEYKKVINGIASITSNFGAEGQAQQSFITNYGNSYGIKDTVQARDLLTIFQGFAFARVLADIKNKWIIEASVSSNYNKLYYKRYEPFLTEKKEKPFVPEWMPRVAASYLFNNFFSVRAIVSKGYSPPTLQEIRSSDNAINIGLQAERGMNYEAGLRLRSPLNYWWWDACIFYYRLENAIVRRSNGAGQEYFVNAGGTDQPGVESQFTWLPLQKRETGLIRGLEISNAATFYFFTFRDYKSGGADYSGNHLTGVPKYTNVTGVNINLPYRFYLFGQYNYVSSTPVNDANTDVSDSYSLVTLKAGWKFISKKRFGMDVSAGVDNLLNERYSPGSDLNAFGGRYYNAALPQNYFAKINFFF